MRGARRGQRRTFPPSLLPLLLPLLLLLLVWCCAVSAKAKHKSGKTGGSRAGKRSVSPARRRDTKTVPASAGTREVHVHFRRGRRASRRLHARIVRIKGMRAIFSRVELQMNTYSRCEHVCTLRSPAHAYRGMGEKNSAHEECSQEAAHLRHPRLVLFLGTAWAQSKAEQW